MITTVPKNANNQYCFTQAKSTEELQAVLQWSINIDDADQACTLTKDAEGSCKASKFRTFASEDMLELTVFCMESGFYVRAELIEQLIQTTIQDNQVISDGVMSGFADYISALSIEVEPSALADLEAYCLANSYQFDERLEA
jgi:hypothetical protein